MNLLIKFGLENIKMRSTGFLCNFIFLFLCTHNPSAVMGTYNPAVFRGSCICIYLGLRMSVSVHKPPEVC